MSNKFLIFTFFSENKQKQEARKVQSFPNNWIKGLALHISATKVDENI